MIDILYEDADFIAVDKPAGLASIPEGASDTSCLQALLARQIGARLWAVHRLDKEVSGVIVFAKTAAAHVFLNDQFFRRLARKEYTALVHGVIEKERSTIAKPIREFGSGRMGVDARGGKRSTTRFEVSARFPGYTLVEAFPETGRRHQLRVHFYSIGHPVAGDRRYGDRSIQERFPRIMLHSRILRVSCPSGKALTVESPLPAEFSRRALHALSSSGT